MVNLASQWEKHRAPLIEEHRRLKEKCSNQEVSDDSQDLVVQFLLQWGKKNLFVLVSQLESSRKLSEIKSMQEKIRVATEEARKKEDIHKQLVVNHTY